MSAQPVSNTFSANRKLTSRVEKSTNFAPKSSLTARTRELDRKCAIHLACLGDVVTTPLQRILVIARATVSAESPIL